MRRLEREQWGAEVTYRDRETEREYRQVAGGLAWPTAFKPAQLVVVGEEYRTFPIPGPAEWVSERTMWVLKEAPAATYAELYRLWRELSEEFLLREWYGQPTDKASLHLFKQQEREVWGEKRMHLVLLGAPYHDSPQGLRVYVQTVNNLVQSAKKLLFFGEGSSLPGHFQNLAPEEVEGKAEDYPAIAALGYAVCALRIYGPVSVQQIQPPSERESWSPYGI